MVDSNIREQFEAELEHLVKIGAIEPIKINVEQIVNRLMIHLHDLKRVKVTCPVCQHRHEEILPIKIVAYRPVIERAKEALVWAKRSYGLPYSDIGRGGVLDTAIKRTAESITEIESILSDGEPT